MKQIFTKLIRLRNPDFSLHADTGTDILFGFAFSTLIQLVRGLQLLFRGRNPRWMLLGKNVRFRYLSRIRFGKMLKTGDYVVFSALGKKGIQLGNQVSIGSFSQVIVSTTLNNPGQGIEIGDRVGIGEFAYLGGGGGLRIGSDCIVGQYFSCHPENHHYADIESLIRLQGVTRKGIEIGSGCWIGSKVTILDGSSIGNHCVIAAGAVVSGVFPDHSVIGGVPARIIKSRLRQSAA